ncbi:hypothetical protein CALVIDRAFT_558083 [Calocera viscosa TUFC12733]|uniref:Uncharacterized protein n=1 Tax=Calocera viscosa (strain TUFC12733) TaxID=1330018 RepID=A0A167HF29_CALVF|nr:hypothetical protein CALVIDRAFT_558083 [Calocera viscosa TUFC12733]
MMKSVLALAAFAVAAFAQTAGNLTVSTPSSLVTCQPALITWSGGVSPYYLSVLPGGQTSATALESFPTQTGTSYTWPKVDIQGGTSITIQIRDGQGNIQYSSPVTIQAGPDTTCVGGNSSGGTILNSSGVGGSATSTGSSSPSSGTSGGASTTGSTTSSPSTSPKSGASGLKAAGFAVAAVAGLVGAALL